MINVDSIHNFLKWAQIERDGMIELHSLIKVDKGFVRNEHLFVYEYSNIISFSRTYHDELLIVGMNPRVGCLQGSAKDSDIANYKNFYIDIEPNHSGDSVVSQEDLTRCEGFINEVCTIFPWISSYGVKAFSGNGYHFCFALPRISATSPMDVYAHLKVFYRDLLQKTETLRAQFNCRIDQTFSPSRQVKLYGTRKPIKGSRFSTFPAVERIESPELYNVIMAYKVEEKEKVAVKIDFKNDVGLVDVCLKYKIDFEELEESICALELDDSSRSGKDFILVKKLVDMGLSDSEIFVVVDNMNYNIGKEITERYMTYTLGKVRETMLEPKKKEEKISEPKRVKLIKYSEIRDKVYNPPVTFKSGIQCIDEYMNGGPALGEVSLWLAEQETGKTNISCFVGGQAKLQGYNVLHVYYEDDDGSIKNRYDEVLKIDHSESEIYFIDMGDGRVDLPQIEEAIKEVKPGLVIIDYLNRIPSIGEDRFSIKKVMEKFGDLARWYNTHCMILDHITIEKDYVDWSKLSGQRLLETKYKIKKSRVAESKVYKLAIVSVCLGLCRDDTADVIWVTGMKMKRKNNKLFKPISVDFEHCNFTEMV